MLMCLPVKYLSNPLTQFVLEIRSLHVSMNEYECQEKREKWIQETSLGIKLFNELLKTCTAQLEIIPDIE